jgi:alkyldihydroxyacetonephosphate synthase
MTGADHATAGTPRLDALRDIVGDDGVSVDVDERAAHGRDCWPRLIMAERAGHASPGPDAVVWPASHDQAAALYGWATAEGVALVPYGGGGGVCGGAAAPPATVAVDTKRLAHLGPLDDTSGLVSAGPGVIGQTAEEWLGVRGWTLGHFPSSITLSSLGGFAAARSAGQASTKYGVFADMVAGMTAVLPDGSTLQRRPAPATAAGPDLTGMLLGSEGALGLITDLVLRVRPKPAASRYAAWQLPGFAAGLDAVRTVLQQDLRPAVVRLADETETAMGGFEVEGCLLVCVAEGHEGVAAAEIDALADAAHAVGGTWLGEEPARHWHAHRYDASYQLADAAKPGGMLGDASVVDTLELAAPWRELPHAYARVRQALAAHMDVVACHASHAYPDGAALYFTLAGVGDGDETHARARYDAAWHDAMEAALAAGATISHHHGVGRLRGGWLTAELGDGGMAALRAIQGALDPAGVANPGGLGLGGGGQGPKGPR